MCRQLNIRIQAGWDYAQVFGAQVLICLEQEAFKGKTPHPAILLGSSSGGFVQASNLTEAKISS